MTQKHLALVISSLQTGGAERVLSELGNKWVDAGYQVSLITLAALDEKPFYTLSSKIHLIQLNQNIQEKVNFLVRVKNIAKRILCLRKCLKQLNPDVIISFVDVMNLTTLLAAKGLRIPVLVAERTNPAYYALSAVYVYARKFLYPWAFKVIVQTQSAAKYFPQSLQYKIEIIPNVVSVPEKAKPSVQIRKPVQQIVSIGRLIASKGFKELITAFAKIIPTYPNLMLTIYGEGEERQNLEALIDSLTLRDKVYLPGNVKNIAEVLRHGDLFVFPSHFEGFPNALCEAMAVGLPVIASNGSGNIDIVKDKINGRLFPIGDINMLATLITEVIDHPEQRAQLSKEAAKLPSQFSEKKILKMWETIINEAINFTGA